MLKMDYFMYEIWVNIQGEPRKILPLIGTRGPAKR